MEVVPRKRRPYSTLEKLEMKKTLVAIAALASVSAFAQVTITGNMDFAGAKVGGSQAWAMGSTFSQTVGTASTSVINLDAVEDIGGGTKVTAHYGLDPRTLSNDGLAVTNNTGMVSSYGGTSTAMAAATAVTATSAVNGIIGSVAGQANTATGLSRDELYVGIAGSFGNLRLGSPNSIGLETFSNASPGGTGIGGGYTGGGTAGTMTNSFVQTRYSRSARYDSPVMSGFSASLMYIPGNDQSATFSNTVAITGAAASGSAVTPGSFVPNAYLILNARAASEYGLKYANGPLTVMYTNISQGLQVNSTGWYATGSNTKASKTSANFITAQYAMGNTTFYVGMNDGQRLAPLGSAGTATDTVDSKGKRYAVKQVIGQTDLMATLTTQEALGVISSVAGTAGTGAYTTSVLKAKVLGFRAQYNLSKTAAVYAGYEKYSTGAAYDTTALTTTGDRTIASMGLRKSF